MRCPPGLSPLETAAGRPVGHVPTARLPPDIARSPLAALEAAIEPALRHGPCRVAFSGGRDSSLLLAVAVGLARRLGLPEPVPVTMRFPDEPGADESAYQERVVAHLGVADWERMEGAADFDLLGPTARSLLERHGPYYPANGHTFVPLLAGRGGGTMLSGFGGDELLGPVRRQRLNDALAARRRPDRIVVREALGAAPPPAVRRAVRRRRDHPHALPWLRPAIQAQLWRRDVAEEDDPRRYDAAVRRTARLRMLASGANTLRRIGDDAGVVAVAPLLDPAFVAALAARGGGTGFGSRAACMAAVVGAHALPPEVLHRQDKATFTASLYGPRARAFAQAWDGEGLDRAVVDSVAVRDAWLSGPGDYRAALLLQSAWCAT